MIDMEADAAPRIPTNEEMEELSTLLQRQREADARVEELKEELKKAQRELWEVETETIPELMTRLQIPCLTFGDGTKVELVEKIKAKIPEKHKAAAFRWLRENGFDSIIKNEVKAAFSRGEDAQAMELMQRLSEEGFVASQYQNVHHSTLRSFVDERLHDTDEDAPELPKELFGVYQYIQAKIS